jgi:hypothetical protein
MPGIQKNVAYTLDIGLFLSGSLVMSPTLATGDFKISKDNGATANLATLPVVAPSSSGVVKVVLAQAEMNADRVTIIGRDAAGENWEDVLVALTTTGDTVDTVKTVVDAILVDTGTTLQAELDGIQADTEDIQTRLPAALVNSRMDSTIDATGFEAAAVDLIWDEAQSGHTSAGSFGIIATEIAAIPTTAMRGTDSANTTTPPTTAEIATALLTTQMTESYAANGVAPTLAQAQFAVHQFMMQHGISGTAWTVRKLDNTTTAFVVTLDDATSPTDAKRV